MIKELVKRVGYHKEQGFSLHLFERIKLEEIGICVRYKMGLELLRFSMKSI